MNNAIEIITDDNLKIKKRHLGLHRAIKKIGSIKSLARHLGIAYSTIYEWYHLNIIPKLKDWPRWCDSKRQSEIEHKLFALTGMTLQELFPEDLEDTCNLLDNDQIEDHDTIELENIEQSLVYSEDESIDKELLLDLLDRLPKKERKVINLRYGIDDQKPLRWTTISRQLKITDTTLKLMEERAINRLRIWINQQYHCNNHE